MDQIGLDDGSSIDTANAYANQYFEAGFSAYNIGCVDDFDNAGGNSGTSMQLVMTGWNGYAGIDGVTGLQANFYDSFEDAGADLVGYVSEDFPGTPVPDPNWMGPAGFDLVGGYATSVWAINAGPAYTSMIPSNEFGTNGQTAAAQSVIGDGLGWQCNPAGGFGFGPYQEVLANFAYRVMGGTGNPCDLPLPTACNADVSGPAGVPDGVVGVDDVLAIIGTYGEVGDGSSRPQGDCNPLPNGNCQVDVDDLLEAIGQYGSDCTPVGACCFGVDGCYDDVTEADCDGDYLGDGSSCASCVSGACCLSDASCIQATPDDCAGSGGAYQGDSSDCADVTCYEAPANDLCENAETISNGDTGVDVTYANTDGPADWDGTLCTTFSNAQVFNDIWFVYTADCDGLLTASTCNQVDFDSRIGFYGSCGGALLACNDDADGCGLTSVVSMDVASGDMVYIRVGRYSEGWGTASSGVLSVSCEVPTVGACCVGQDCYDLLPSDCDAFGGAYQGTGTDCATTECGVSNGECETAASVTCNSSTAFDTTDATDSGFGEPDDTQCSGTYLDWSSSPDVWFRLESDTDGTMDVSLCDSASYDTSLVLYAGNDCNSLTQVACNGDNTVESGCQTYYSGIYGHPIAVGDVFYVRIGGWQAATGPGTLTITCIGGSTEAACCIGGDCYDGYTSSDCDAAGGSWYNGQDCAGTTCPQDVSCSTGNGQDPILPEGAWTAGTSDTGSGYIRAMGVSAPGVADVTVYGLSLVYSGGWGACGTPDTMPMQYELMDSSMNVLASGTGSSYIATNLTYAGVYVLHGWAVAPGYSGQVDVVSLASQSGGQGECWFLWMSSTADGDGQSYMNGVLDQTFGLNYCITE